MSKAKRLTGGALLLALIALTFYLLLRNQPISQLLDVLGKIKPGYVILGLGLMFVFVGSEAMCSKLILGRLGHALPYRRCLGFSFVGFYVSSITPSATGGQPAQIFYMQRQKIDIPTASIILMLVTIEYKFVLVFIGLALALFGQPLVQTLPPEAQFYLYLGLGLNVFCSVYKILWKHTEKPVCF